MLQIQKTLFSKQNPFEVKEPVFEPVDYAEDDTLIQAIEAKDFSPERHWNLEEPVDAGELQKFWNGVDIEDDEFQYDS